MGPPYTRLPYWVEDFLEYYGPIILDVILAFPLVQIYRRFHTQCGNAFTAKRNRPYILQLPDELLLEVCHFVKISGCPSKNGQFHGCGPARRALTNLSKTNKRMRELAAPLLFRKLVISDGWRRADRSLKALEKSTSVCHIPKTFEFQHSSYRDKGGAPPRRLPTRLALIIPSLLVMDKLVLNVSDLHTKPFQKAFEDRVMTLPGVRTLVLGPHMDWLISMCPNVRTISTTEYSWLHHSDVDRDCRRRHSYELIRAAGRAENLQHFEMMECWERRHLWAIRKSIPDIQSLAMAGGSYNDGIAQLLPILAHFDNLRTLALTSAAELRMRFNPSRCGNVYLGPGGDGVKTEVARQRRQAEYQVAELVFKWLDKLLELWVGDDAMATVSRLPTGGVEKITWRWEQRPKAYCSYRRFD